MIGYRNKRYKDFGWAAAHLDDLFNLIPARITGLLLPISALICRKDWKGAFLTIIRDRRKNPSPNSGWPQAGIAGALKIQLGGVNYYQGKKCFKPYLGEAKESLNIRHIKESIKIVYVSSFLFLLLGLILLWVKEIYAF